MANMKKLLCGTFACIMVVAGALGMASCGKKDKACTHEWSETTQQATCVDNGEIKKECVLCGEVETEVISAKGHSYGAWQETKPTCTEKGKKVRKCANCSSTEEEPIGELGHSYVVVEKAATCEADGLQFEQCTVCKEEKENSRVVLPKKGHDWQLGSDGLEYCARVCLDSGEKDDDGNVIYTTLYASKDLEYSADGSTVIGIGNCYDTKLYIPSINPENGAAVTEVGSAFTGLSAVEFIEIIGNVTKIADGACSSCVNLKAVVLADSVITLGGVADGEEAKGVFTNCENLTSVDLGAVEYIGEKAFEGCTGLKEIVIPETVKTLAAGSFKGCAGLEKAVVGYVEFDDKNEVISSSSNIAAIENEVFYGCSNLTALYLADGIKTIGEYAFANCGISDITIPDTVETIGAYAFSDCSALKRVVLGRQMDVAALTEIGEYAFSNCGNLEMVSVPKTLSAVGDGAFYCADGAGLQIEIYSMDDWSKIDFATKNANPLYHNANAKLCEMKEESGKSKLTTVKEVVITGNKIGSYAFAGYTAMTSVDIGETVTEIGEEAFAECPALASIKYNAANAVCLSERTFWRAGTGIELVVGDTVQSIPAYLFQATYITTAELGAQVATIGEKAFNGCGKLTKLVMGDAVTTIGEKAFGDCGALAEVVIPAAAIEYVPQGSLKTLTVLNGEIADCAFDYCANLETVTIGAGVTGMGKYAFANCAKLKTLTIENGANIAVAAYAFVDCVALEKASLGDGVTSIGKYAFYNCGALKEVVIGDAVTTIETCAFQYCKSLEKAVIGLSVTKIEKNAFEYCQNLKGVDFRDRLIWTIQDEAKNEMWSTNVAEPATAAKYLTETYVHYEWLCA